MGQETSNVWYSGSTSSSSVMDSITFGYDANNNMTLAADNAATYTMAYDPLNRVTQAVEIIGASATVTLTMAYDGNGDRTLLQNSLGGTIDYSYDTDGDLTTEVYTQSTGATTSVVMSFEEQYDWQGRVTDQLDYSGATLVGTSSMDYNALGEVASISQFASTAVANYSMTYDVNREVTEQIDHGVTNNFAYDSLGQETSFGTVSQTYNANGSNAAYTATYGDEVTYDGTNYHLYDQAGNETETYDTTTGTTWAYSYDNQNHLIKAQETVTGTLTMQANYEYDAFGSQVEESVATLSGGTWTTTVTAYVQDSWNPAKEYASGELHPLCDRLAVGGAVSPSNR